MNDHLTEMDRLIMKLSQIRYYCICSLDYLPGTSNDFDVEDARTTWTTWIDALEHAIGILEFYDHPDFGNSFLNPDDYVRIGDVQDCLSEVFRPEDDLMHIEGLIEWAMGKRAISLDELCKLHPARDQPGKSSKPSELPGQMRLQFDNDTGKALI